MHKGSGLLIGLSMVAATLCACGVSPPVQENTATVIETINQVDAHSRPTDDWEPATEGMTIYGGGQVRTGLASSAQLELLEGLVRLAAETIFTVKESTVRQGRLETTLLLESGRLWAHLTPSQPHEFKVETPSAVAAVRDSRISIGVYEDQTTIVSVAEGEAEVTAQNKSVTVVAGQQTIVKLDQPPSPPEPMSDEELALWATQGGMPEMAPPTPTPTPTPPPTPSPTPESTVEQINRAIAEKGYAWQAGLTNMAGLKIEEIHKRCEDITGLVDQASSARSLLSPQEIKHSLDAGGRVVGEMIVYQDFLYYRDGIYRHAWGDQIGRHAVEIEGYDDTQSCWHVKNSWGTDWGGTTGYGDFRIAYGEAGIEEKVYEIAYETTPTPAPTPMPMPTPTPTPEEEEAIHRASDTLSTPTPARAPTFTPTPTAREYVAEGYRQIEAVIEHYEDHDCERWIPGAREAIRQCTMALEQGPDADAHFCRALGYTYIEEPIEAVNDLKQALELGLTGEKKAKAEEMLVELEERLAAPACSIGPILFLSEGRSESGEPINPSEICAPKEKFATEIHVGWELYGSCNQPMVVKWRRNTELMCYHYYREDEHTRWEGSTYYEEEGPLPDGLWTVSVYVGATEIGSASCNISSPE